MIGFPYTNFHRLNLDALSKIVGKLVEDVKKIPTKTSQLINDSGFINIAQAIAAAPVKSVNGKTGNVTLNASDVGALPDTYTPPKEVFWCTYGVTTNAEIENALDNGQLPCVFGSTGEFYCVLSRRQSATAHYFGGTYTTSTGNKYLLSIRCNNGTWTQTSAIVAATASPTFTGTPNAPTAAAGTNTTQLATTAFVQQEIKTIEYGALTASNVHSSAVVRAASYRKNNKVTTFSLTLNVTAQIPNGDLIAEFPEITGPDQFTAFIKALSASASVCDISMQNVNGHLAIYAYGAVNAGDWQFMSATYINND